MNAPVETLFMGGFACGVAFTLMAQTAFRLLFDAVDAAVRRVHKGARDGR